MSARPKPASRSEKSSIRPLGVWSGYAAGSARNAVKTGSAYGSCGRSTPPSDQNSANDGAAGDAPSARQSS